MPQTFSVLFLLLFMLTVPMHGVTNPFAVLFFNFSIIFIHLFPPPFSIFMLFWMTGSWNRSGWHPRSLTGQCTSHLPLSLQHFPPFVSFWTICICLHVLILSSNPRPQSSNPLVWLTFFFLSCFPSPSSKCSLWCEHHAEVYTVSLADTLPVFNTWILKAFKDFE